MIKVSRDWATPLTAGVFAMMAVTGLLLFFHLDKGLNKAAHEWLGWLLVTAVVLHGTTNWLALKRHLLAGGRSRIILLACALALVASFLVPVGAGGASPPVRAFRAVTRAPVSALAPLAGRPVSQLKAELAAAGIAIDRDDQSIDSAVAGDRAKLGAAMAVLFPDRN